MLKPTLRGLKYNSRDNNKITVWFQLRECIRESLGAMDPKTGLSFHRPVGSLTILMKRFGRKFLLSKRDFFHKRESTKIRS